MNDNLFKELFDIFPANRISKERQVLEKHSHYASSHNSIMPDIVVYPTSTAEVCKLLRFASENKIFVTPYEQGTSLEGNPIPVKNGIVLNLSMMNKILNIYEKDFQVKVEPGILGDRLNKELAKHNLYFPAFPASSHIASVGGMIANNAGGMYAVKYGVVGNWVLQLTVVLANGDIIKVGSRSIKSVAGYDLKSLFIGSEGTLGIITMAILRLIPSIPGKLLCRVSFETVENAVAATQSILYANLDPAAVEFLDTESIKYVNMAQKLGFIEAPTVLIEFHGENNLLKEKGRMLSQIAKKNKCVFYEEAERQEDMQKIWAGRKAIHPSFVAAFPDAGILSGDIGVPISQISVFMKYVNYISKKYAIPTTTFGHLGDGNFHVWAAYDKRDKKSLEKAQEVNGLLVAYALDLGGTCTAEHGVGIGKRKYLVREHPTSIGIMKDIKKLLDPKGILNPGKIFI